MATETQLVLVRHGQSVWNAEGRVVGQADPPLSALGWRQAEETAWALRRRPAAAVYCSSLARARDTGAAICRVHGLQLSVLDAFREVNLGAWEGRTKLELSADPSARFHALSTHWLGRRPPGGESLEEALARASPAIRTILAAHAGERIVLVTHSILGRALLAELVGTGRHPRGWQRLKTGSITIVRFREVGPSLTLFGYTGHLSVKSTTM